MLKNGYFLFYQRLPDMSEYDANLLLSFHNIFILPHFIQTDRQITKLTYFFYYNMFSNFRLVYNYIVMQKHQHNIVLTASQKLVFDTLMQYRQELHLKTVLRVAGGWVRDKFMGKESHDIDIALDDMKGEEFVLLLKKHAETKNQKISSFGVTKLNPDLSKHLQTATAKIHNENIDFVNLRSQTYNNQSRIPIIEVGTPLTDALRRDFTINSLFFNINTQQIQDWTQRGIADIENRIIRTPLEPLITFTDDPLRVLRCFRFKARFDYAIHEDIYASLMNEGVHEALRTKVSKQRIGIEMSGILKAMYPMSALDQIYKYKFWNIIFDIPKESDLKDQTIINGIPEYSYFIVREGRKSLQTNGLLTYKMLVIDQGQQVKDKRPRYSQQDLKVMINLVFLTLVYRNHKVQEGKKWLNLIDHMVRNQLKYSAKISKFTHKSGELINDLQKVLLESTQDNLKIKVIRWLRLAEQKWQIILHAYHVMQMAKPNDKVFLSPLELRQFIVSQCLEDTYLVQSFIDGSFIIKQGKKGPIIRTILENSIIWKVLNPKSDKQSFLQLFQKNLPFFQNDKSYQ